ncbi:MAG: oxygen-independent coproporphyrinogen III oxidase [Halioglobus sp.]
MTVHPNEIELAQRYACQGPRYTSYPTALQFHGDFPFEQFHAQQRNCDADKHEPLSLYVHIPFCQDICYYCACNKVVTRRSNSARDYLLHLKTEIALQSALVGNDRPVTQLHWGGGTPNYLDNAEITELMHELACHFRLVDKGYREYSIEIDPRTVQHDTIALLKGLGFNRISLGIQDFDPLVQQAINRIQPYAQVAALVDCVRRYDFRSLSFDLLYGLPHQDRFSMEETIRRVIALRPDRIASYNYAHMPDQFISQRAIDRQQLPSPAEKLLLQQIISQSLQDGGYLHIGMDHYVLPEDDLAIAQQEGRLQRNFQGYSLHMADDVLGLGASAISQIGDFYLQNERDLGAYYARLDKGEHPASRGFQATAEDKLRRYIIMSLMCELKLDMGECKRRFDIEFADKFSSQLQQLKVMAADKLVQLEGDEIRVTSRGRTFLRNICMLFDAYLEPRPESSPAQSYSSTI